jgi:hypothetical protein
MVILLNPKFFLPHLLGPAMFFSANLALKKYYIHQISYQPDIIAMQ